MSSAEELHKTGLAFYEALNSRDAEALTALADTPDTAAKLREALEEALIALPDFTIEVLKMVAEGDTLMSTFEISGTHHGKLFRFQGTGTAVTFRGLHVTTFDGGKIVVQSTWAGAHAALQQLGVLFVHPATRQVVVPAAQG